MLRSLIITIIYIAFFTGNANSQVPDWKWVKPINGIVTAFDVDSAGNSYVTGYYQGVVSFDTVTLVSNGDYDFFIGKYDISGQLKWMKGYGSTGIDQSFSLIIGANEVPYISARIQGSTLLDTILINNGFDSQLIAKFNPSNGQCMWAKALPGGIPYMGDPLAIDPNRNVYSTGTFYIGYNGCTSIVEPSFFISGNSFLTKISNNDNCDWSINAVRPYGSGVFPTIAVATNGDSYIYGGTGSPLLIGNDSLYVDNYWGFGFVGIYDANGSYKWSKVLGVTDTSVFSDLIHRKIVIDNDYSFYLIGYQRGTILYDADSLIVPTNSNQIYIVKFDSNGNWLWGKTIGSLYPGPVLSDLGLDITLDIDGNIYMTGFFIGTANFGTFNLTSSGQYDLFIAKYDENGSCLWAKQAGGIEMDAGKQVVILKDKIFVLGSIGDDPVFDSINISNAGFMSFVGMLDTLPHVGIAQDMSMKPKIVLFPNPTENIVFIQTEQQIFNVKIYNLLYEPILHLADRVNQIDLTNQPSGVYFVEITTDQGTITKKLVLNK